MMKIAVFSTKPYNREFLASANDPVHELRSFEPRLTNETVHSRPTSRRFASLCERSRKQSYHSADNS
jgi:hypothetical protein